MPGKVKSIRELRSELQIKETMLSSLRARRDKLGSQLAALERQIAALSGGARRGRKPGRRPATPKAAAKRTPKLRPARRGRRGTPLVDYVQNVLKKAPKPMRVKEVVKAVTAAGYKSDSKDFYGIVATALRDPKKFHKVKRGVYKLK